MIPQFFLLLKFGTASKSTWRTLGLAGNWVSEKLNWNVKFLNMSQVASKPSRSSNASWCKGGSGWNPERSIKLLYRGMFECKLPGDRHETVIHQVIWCVSTASAFRVWRVSKGRWHCRAFRGFGSHVAHLYKLWVIFFIQILLFSYLYLYLTFSSHCISI